MEGEETGIILSLSFHGTLKITLPALTLFPLGGPHFSFAPSLTFHGVLFQVITYVIMLTCSSQDY